MCTGVACHHLSITLKSVLGFRFPWGELRGGDSVARSASVAALACPSLHAHGLGFGCVDTQNNVVDDS
jgi:hypothetical protein